MSFLGKLQPMLSWILATTASHIPLNQALQLALVRGLAIEKSFLFSRAQRISERQYCLFLTISSGKIVE